MNLFKIWLFKTKSFRCHVNDIYLLSVTVLSHISDSDTGASWQLATHVIGFHYQLLHQGRFNLCNCMDLERAMFARRVTVIIHCWVSVRAPSRKELCGRYDMSQVQDNSNRRCAGKLCGLIAPQCIFRWWAKIVCPKCQWRVARRGSAVAKTTPLRWYEEPRLRHGHRLLSANCRRRPRLPPAAI